MLREEHREEDSEGVGVRAGRESEAEEEGEEAAEGDEEEGGGAEEEERLAGEGEEEEEGVRGGGREEGGEEEGEGDEEEDRGEDRGIKGKGIDDRGECDAGGGGEEGSERGFSAKFATAEETEVPGFDNDATERAEDRLPGAGVNKGVDRGAKGEAGGYPSRDKSEDRVNRVRGDGAVFNKVTIRCRYAEDDISHS